MKMISTSVVLSIPEMNSDIDRLGIKSIRINLLKTIRFGFVPKNRKSTPIITELYSFQVFNQNLTNKLIVYLILYRNHQKTLLI